MKISEKLPQFKDLSALLIVASTHGAEFYLASDGTIEKLDAFRISPARFSDKEGFFARLGRGRVFGMGAVLEPPKEKERKEFFAEFERRARALEKRAECVYLFAPGYILPDVEKRLSSSMKGLVKERVEANCVGEHPFELLKRIA